MPMITGFFPVVGFMLIVTGLILTLRAIGVVNRSRRARDILFRMNFPTAPYKLHKTHD
jgi:hypothetical protein